MSLDTLQDLMVAELKDIYSAETQIVRAMPKLAKAVGSERLKAAMTEHLEQTKGQVARLEQIFEMLDTSPRGKKCKGMEGLLEEGSEMAEEDGEDAVRDAGIIASAQRVEHYEIAAYGSTIAFATQLGHAEIVTLLQASLDEEKATDVLLSGLAEGEINAAAAIMDEESEEDGDEEENAAAGNGTAKRGSAKKSATRSASASKGSTRQK